MQFLSTLISCGYAWLNQWHAVSHTDERFSWLFLLWRLAVCLLPVCADANIQTDVIMAQRRLILVLSTALISSRSNFYDQRGTSLFHLMWLYSSGLITSSDMVSFITDGVHKLVSMCDDSFEEKNSVFYSLLTLTFNLQNNRTGASHSPSTKPLFLFYLKIKRKILRLFLFFQNLRARGGIAVSPVSVLHV